MQQTQCHATPCRVYPVEYAYHKNSVDRAEIPTANCINYEGHLHPGLSVSTEDYVHCNGTRLRLSDSEVGPQSQYVSGYNYQWSAGTEIRQLLFIFPTRVNLTNITLHYYSDSQRGLPPLRFYAVPDNFNVWDAAPSSASVTVAAIPAGSQLTAGIKNISIDVYFNTTKVLMVKAGSFYKFALSEVEFISCFSGKLLVINYSQTYNYAELFIYMYIQRMIHQLITK